MSSRGMTFFLLGVEREYFSILMQVVGLMLWCLEMSNYKATMTFF